MNLDFINKKTKMIIASTLSILGVILIVIGFNISKTTNFISSNNTSYQDNNKKIEKIKEDNKSEIIDNNEEENFDTSKEKEDETTIEDVDETTNVDTLKDEPIEEDNNDNKTEITDIKNTLTIYKDDDNYCKAESDTCNTIADTIETDSNDAKILEFSKDNNYMLYKDNTLKIYNTNTKEINKINLENTDEETYKFITDKDTTMGLIYKDKDTDYMGYYNILESKKMYENKYSTIDTTDYEDYLIASLKEEEKVNYSLIKTNEEQVELTDKTNNSCELNFKIYTNNNSKIFIEYSTCPEEGIKRIYSNSKKILASNLQSKDYYSIYDGNIYINDNNDVKKYDFEGNIIDNKKISEFKQLIRNNIIYVENNNLFLYDMNTKENIKFGEWDSNNIYQGN